MLSTNVYQDWQAAVWVAFVTTMLDQHEVAETGTI